MAPTTPSSPSKAAARPKRRRDVEAAQPWTRDAACAGADPELFFPANTRQPATEAKQICAACPVRAECLEYSLANEEEFGVWGGLTEKERRQLLDKRHHHDGHGQHGTPDQGAA
jgi:WhiB family redox-sensing transcriptional regulator